MELDDLKQTWKETKNTMQEHQALSPAQFKLVSGSNYHSKMRRIIIPEIVGSIICLAAAVYLGLRFVDLDTYLLQAAGLLSILLLLCVPVISILSTWKLYKVGDVKQPYALTLQSFAVQKIRFVKLQKLNVTLCYLLLVLLIIILFKLFNNQNISGNNYYWLFSFTIGFIFLLFYSRWVESYYYKSLRQAEDLLRELNT